jgi:hypothetical protein
MTYPVSFTVDGSAHLIGTVSAVGDGGVENGLLFQSIPFTGPGSIDLGAAKQSVSSSSSSLIPIQPASSFRLQSIRRSPCCRPTGSWSQPTRTGRFNRRLTVHRRRHSGER